MTILINNQEAILKKNSSFDFIAENRLFTGSDSYTLTMTFPWPTARRTGPSSATSTARMW